MTGETRLDNAAGVNPGQPRQTGATRVETSGIATPNLTRVESSGTPPSGTFITHRLPPGLAERFELTELAGHGGEAFVYRAERLDGGGTVALKVFTRKPRYAVDLNSDEYRRHFPREHAVEVYERGEELGVHYEVMEYCPAGTLADLNARSAPFTAEFLTAVVEEIAAALETMHPMVHGDLKPSNVLIRSVNPLDLVLSDFGLTVDLAGRSSLTNHGHGTAAYLAPGGGARTRPASDWWALGMTILDLVLGRNVFQHDDGAWVDDATITDHVASRPIPLDGVPPGRVRDLIRGLFVRDSARRWGAAEVREWLGGGSPPIPDDVTPSDRPVRAIRGYAFSGRVYTDAVGLGRALRSQPDRARALAGGVELHELAEWAQTAAPEADLAQVLSKAPRYKPDLLATLAAQRLDPDGVISYAGKAISAPRELVQLATDPAARPVVMNLHHQRVLAVVAFECGASDLKFIDDRWRELADLTGALVKSAPKPVPDAEILAHALTAAASLDALDALRASARKKATALAIETPWFAKLLTADTDPDARTVAIILLAGQAENQATDARSRARAAADARAAQKRAADQEALARRRAEERRIAKAHQAVTGRAIRRIPANMFKLLPVWGGLVGVGFALSQPLTPDDQFQQPTVAVLVALGIWLVAHLVGGRAARLRFAWLGLFAGLAFLVIPLATHGTTVYLDQVPIPPAPPWFAYAPAPEAAGLNGPVWLAALRLPAIVAVAYVLDCHVHGERRGLRRQARAI